ncbi:MAG: hypothetical protein GY928_04155 [Colwellia sp.]|nr:hypothetical protein [Colwellia sp.]
MTPQSDNELTPFGKILAVVGFFTGFSAVWQNSQKFWPSFIVGAIIAVIGGFVGDIIWRLIIVAISLAVAIGTFYVRSEVTSAVVEGIKSSQYSQDTVTQGQAQKNLVCVTNETSSVINFSYRWNEGKNWQKIALKPSWHQWFSNPFKTSLNVSFDNKIADGYQGTSVVLETKKSTQEDCDNAKQYKFNWYGDTLSLSN